MHAGGFVTQKRRSPIGLGGAVAVHGVVIAVYLLTPKEVFEHLPPVITLATNIPVARKLDPSPPPPPQQQKVEPRNKMLIPKSEVTTLSDGPRIDAVPERDIKLTSLPPLEDVTQDTHPAQPVLVDARPDPRYRADFQPDYPTNLQRLELEGSVTVRVKIGSDGKVKAVQMVSASHDDFFKATERQALRRWRFKPATRDGEPVESWREMTVHFRIEN